jgi:hypothetical protein
MTNRPRRRFVPEMLQILHTSRAAFCCYGRVQVRTRDPHREGKMKVEEMTDEQLLASVKRFAAREREATAAVEGLLAVIDARRPGMRQGWPRRIDEEGAVRPAPRRRRRA